MAGSVEHASKQSTASRHSDRPLVAVGCSFSLGIALSLALRQYSFPLLVTAGISLICAAVLAFRRNRPAISAIAALGAISICGLLVALAHRDGFPGSDLRSHIARLSFPLGQPVAFDGCVVKESEIRGEESVATVEMDAFLRNGRWTVCRGKGIIRTASPGPEQARESRLMRGDRVRGWATWNTPRNYENPGSADTAGILARRGIFLVGRVKTFQLLEPIPGGCSDPWTRVANHILKRVQTSLEPLRGKEGGKPAAILASLVVGDYSGLDNRTREIFQNSGTFHVLVVSGLHVAWIAAVIIAFLKLAGIPERIRSILASLVILLYTCVVGFQASITRCLWMFLLYLAGRILFRRADPVNILLGSALILLSAQPDWLFETGFQLSFLSVLAIAMTAAPLISDYLNPMWAPLRSCGKTDRLFLQTGAWHRRGRTLRVRLELLVEDVADPLPAAVSRFLLLGCRILAAIGTAIGNLILSSLAVQIWIEPLLAGYFNRMSWISPLANLVIVPFSSIVLSAGVLAVTAANVPVFGPAFMRMAGSLSSLLLSCAERMTAIEGTWQRCPTPSPPWILAAILILFAWSFFGLRRYWIPCGGIVLLLACLSYGSIPGLGILIQEFRHHFKSKQESWDRTAPVLSLTFLDVGEGDCTVIRFPDMRVWIVDAGGLRLPSQPDAAFGFDVGEAVVSRYLWHMWIGRLDRLVLSHPDADHAGGVPALMKNFRVSRFEYSQATPDLIMDSILGTAHKRKIPARRTRAGIAERIGPVHLRVLNPAMDSRFSSTNENSVVLELSFGRFSALLTGDLEKSAETELLARSKPSRCKLLKVAHHGSRSGTSDWFLDRICPEWAVISVGRNNPYGHPSKETLARIVKHGSRPLLTLDEGAITFETDGRHYLLKSHLRGLLERGTLREKL